MVVSFVVAWVVDNKVDSSVVVFTVVSTVEVSVVVSSAVVLASSVKVSSSVVEGSGSTASVLAAVSTKVFESDVKMKVVKGMEDTKVSGGGWEDEMFENLNVVDGLGTIMGLSLVLASSGRVVTTGNSVSAERVGTGGGASSEDEGTTMIGPRDDTEDGCWACLVVIVVEVKEPSWQS